MTRSVPNVASTKVYDASQRQFGDTPRADSSRPRRRVLSILRKKPALVAAPLDTKTMSSRVSLANPAALIDTRPQRARTPSSPPRVTTCSRGGSETNALGSRHGSSGSAQVNSTGVGTRELSERLAKSCIDDRVLSLETSQTRPTDGKSRLNS